MSSAGLVAAFFAMAFPAILFVLTRDDFVLSTGCSYGWVRLGKICRRRWPKGMGPVASGVER